MIYKIEIDDGDIHNTLALLNEAVNYLEANLPYEEMNETDEDRQKERYSAGRDLLDQIHNEVNPQ